MATYMPLTIYMNVKITKSIPKGIISAPPSKSYTHRYLIASMFSNKGTIKNVLFSEDIKATLNCLEAFGVTYEKKDDSISILSNEKFMKNPVFDCNESGSTLRFLIPIVLTKYDKVTFKGTPKLISRGIGVYEKILKNQKITIDEQIHIEGKLKPGEFIVDGSISSQYITGLLFALPLLDKESTIKIIPPINSKPYIDISLDILTKYKIEYKIEENSIYIPGNQKYIANDYFVEGDYSNAAFLDAFNYFGGNIKIENLNKDSLQGDKVFIDYFRILNEKNTVLDISNCIDLGPVLFMFAALKHGATFIGTARLKIKESNRALAMKEELKKCSIKIDIEENSVIVHKNNITKPNVCFESHNDHRIVMALSLLSTLFDITINDASAVMKSYPHYFKDLEKLGVEIEYE